MKELLERNKVWAEQAKDEDADVFARTAQGQSPTYLCIACVDSRVPVSSVLGLAPGEALIHRNIANQANSNDSTAMSAIQFALEALGIRKIIVLGHYGCGGVAASQQATELGHVDQWVKQIGDSLAKRGLKSFAPTDKQGFDSACEHNILAQLEKLEDNPVVKRIRESGEEVDISGLVYRLDNGLVRVVSSEV